MEAGMMAQSVVPTAAAPSPEEESIRRSFLEFQAQLLKQRLEGRKSLPKLRGEVKSCRLWGLRREYLHWSDGVFRFEGRVISLDEVMRRMRNGEFAQLGIYDLIDGMRSHLGY